MTRQEMFDKAYLGVIAQGGLGKDPNTGGCMYLTPQGKSCGVGQLLTPEQRIAVAKDDVLNGDVPGQLVKHGYFPADFDVPFARLLQKAHDSAGDLEKFRENMICLASLADLTVPSEVLA